MADGAKPAQLTIDGIAQLYYSEVETDTVSGDKILETIPLGAIGHSDGATVVRISGMSIVPNTGREFDFQEASEKHVTHDVGIRLAAKSKEYRGRFPTVKEVSKVNDTVTISWQFEGRVIR